MKSPLLLVLWALSLTTTAACADTLRVFDYEGTFSASPDGGGIGTVSGSITIDATTGIVTDGSPFLITLPSSSYLRELTEPPEIDVYMGNTGIGLFSITVGPNSYASVELLVPVSTLVGYTGSILCTEATPCPDGEVSVVLPNRIYSTSFITGSLTQVAPTPEPSTLALLSTGIFALAGTVRRRLRP